MLRITLLCNAGLALEYKNELLLIDLPNDKYGAFFTLPEETRVKILNHIPPYNKICGIFYTHTHPDHCSEAFVNAYRKRWLNDKVFLPQEKTLNGSVQMGPFDIEFERMPHAPISGAPPLVVAMVRVGERQVYIASDAELDCEKHRAFLRKRRADAAFWNAMYLSKESTRSLLHEAANKNYVYHMPADHEDAGGLWRKCRANFKRNGDQLNGVEVLGTYPSYVELP